MSDLADQIAQDPQLTWLVGKVEAVYPGSITVRYRGGLIYGVGYLDQYTPVAGDVVHCLSLANKGIIALGSNNDAPALPALPTPTVNAVTSTGGITYDKPTGTWISGRFQAPDRLASWFYTAGAFATLATIELGKFEMTVNRTSGGPPEFRLHRNLAATGTLVLEPGPVFVQTNPPVGVLTWVSLPLDWGQQILRGSAYGISIGGSVYSGVYATGMGQLRFTSV